MKYEKLLLLKNRMNTRLGKAIAESRHQFMEQYLAQFFRELDLADSVTMQCQVRMQEKGTR